MHTRRGFTIVVGAAVAVASIGLAVDGVAQAPAAGTPRTLVLSTPFDAGTTHHIDLGKKSPRGGPGDMFLVTEVPLNNESTGRRAATLEGTETILSAAHNGIVSFDGTIRLHDGTIQLAGVTRHDRPGRLAITGGTGAYAGARGEMTDSEDETRKVSIERITLLP